MHIARRPIGPAHPVYVIAELGVNHDGSLSRALELVRHAADAGASAIKLQLFDADLLMSSASTLAGYQEEAGETDPRAMLRRLQLSLGDMAKVVDAAHALHLHAIVTVFSVELVALAQKLPFDAYKTASPDIVHRPLLEALAATGKPLIVSTGASTLKEVGRALTWLRDVRSNLAVLQCVSSYPTPVEQAELGGVGALADIFDGPVGYSDHTRSLATGAIAVLAGACVLEKHLTYDTTAPGPDHAASLSPSQMHEYRNLAHAAMQPLLAVQRENTTPPGVSATGMGLAGGGVAGDFVQLMPEELRERTQREMDLLLAQPKIKRVLPIEEDVRRVSRQSIVTRAPLAKGHVLTREDVTFKRPGTGILPCDLGLVLGRTLSRDVIADAPLTPADLSPQTAPN